MWVDEEAHLHRKSSSIAFLSSHNTSHILTPEALPKVYKSFADGFCAHHHISIVQKTTTFVTF